MADLVTHACVGALVSFRWGRGAVALSVLGAVLPDVVSRVPGLALVRIGIEEDWVHTPLQVGHVPVGTILWVLLVAQLFRDRRRAATWLGVGAISHYALDLTQDHFGVGYRLWVPFSGVRFELGWIGSEATVPWALPLLAVTLLLMVLGRPGDEERRRTTDEGSVGLGRRGAPPKS